jgi:hypothetical protein
MFDFEQLVKGLLLVLESKTDLLNQVKSKLPGVNEFVLNEIYSCITSTGGKYYKPVNWEPYIDYTYLLNAVVAAACNDPSIINANEGKAKTNYKAYLKSNPDDVDQFYNFIWAYWDTNPRYLNSLKTIDKLDFKDFNQFTKRIYQAALSEKGASALKENIFQQIKNLTIVNSLLSIFNNRLTKMNQLKITVNMLVPKLTNFKTSTLELFIKDVIDNVDAYSAGKKPANIEILEVINDLHISFEDLLNIALNTKKVYTTILQNNLPDWDKTGSENSFAYKYALTKENIYKFAKEGKIDISQKDSTTGGTKIISIHTPTSTSSVIKLFTLEEIYNTKIAEGVELYKQIKDICTGINKKAGAGERLAAGANAAAGLAAIGGVKSGFSM